jgi:hypothetical protein
VKLHRAHIGAALVGLGFCVIIVDAFVNLENRDRPRFPINLLIALYPPFYAALALIVIGSLLAFRRRR